MLSIGLLVVKGGSLLDGCAANSRLESPWPPARAVVTVVVVLVVVGAEVVELWISTLLVTWGAEELAGSLDGATVVIM